MVLALPTHHLPRPMEGSQEKGRRGRRPKESAHDRSTPCRPRRRPGTGPPGPARLRAGQYLLPDGFPRRHLHPTRHPGSDRGAGARDPRTGEHPCPGALPRAGHPHLLGPQPTRARRGVGSVSEEAGLGNAFIHRTGHGIGIDYHELPFFAPGDETVLAPGMVMSVEPGIYIPGVGGFRHSDTIVVTEDGCEILTPYPKDLESLIVG